MASTSFTDGVTLTAASWFNDINDGIYKGVGTTGYSTVASATTPDIFATTVSGVINYTGTTTCTGFVAAPSAGARRVLVCAGAAVFTAGSNMLIDGVSSGSNLTCAANDLVYVYALTTTQFRLSRIPYSGFASGPTLGTSTASTSGTSIDFTGIPSTAKRLSVNFVGVSTNGTSPLMVQIGKSGGVETSGYTSSAAGINSSGNGVRGASTTGFVMSAGGAGAGGTLNGTMVITLEKLSANTWCAFGTADDTGDLVVWYFGGSKSLAGTLDRVRITATNGTDTFDAGEINITYE